MPFTWYQVVDGVAIPIEDTPEVSAMIDAGKLKNIYGNIEGAIINGGVQATAFKRRVEKTYDAVAWLSRGEKVETGEVLITEITAEPKEEGSRPYYRRGVAIKGD